MEPRTRTPSRPRPARRRTRETPARPRAARRRPTPPPAVVPVEREEARPATGGGSFGRGPVDDDGGRGRRPDRDGDSSRPLLIALALLALGAGVLGARLAAQAGARRRRSPLG